MTQGRLFSTVGEPLLVAYTIDTSSLVWLDGLNLESDGMSRRYTPDEAADVWRGLDQLGAQGLLKTIRMVRRELAANDRPALERLQRQGRQIMAPPISNRTRVAYQAVVAQFPGAVNPDWSDDPADPWLVAYAGVYGYMIITDELPARMHAARRNQRRVYIPDMCDSQHPRVPWTGLRDLAYRANWLERGDALQGPWGGKTRS